MSKFNPIFAIAISSISVALSGTSKATPPYFVVAGDGVGGQSGRNYWTICGSCKLLAYRPEKGTLSVVGPFSDDASDSVFAYVPGSVSYDSLRNHISFIASIPPDSGGDYSDYAWLITIDARNGKTIHKQQWDIATYGYAMTMVEGE